MKKGVDFLGDMEYNDEGLKERTTKYVSALSSVGRAVDS